MTDKDGQRAAYAAMVEKFFTMMEGAKFGPGDVLETITVAAAVAINACSENAEHAEEGAQILGRLVSKKCATLYAANSKVAH